MVAGSATGGGRGRRLSGGWEEGRSSSRRVGGREGRARLAGSVQPGRAARAHGQRHSRRHHCTPAGRTQRAAGEAGAAFGGGDPAALCGVQGDLLGTAESSGAGSSYQDLRCVVRLHCLVF